MKIETHTIDNEDTELYIFDNWMSHDDWHEVEKLGLKYIKYVHEGPDYWDDYLIFAKLENVEKIIRWYTDWEY